MTLVFCAMQDLRADFPTTSPNPVNINSSSASEISPLGRWRSGWKSLKFLLFRAPAFCYFNIFSGSSHDIEPRFLVPRGAFHVKTPFNSAAWMKLKLTLNYWSWAVSFREIKVNRETFCEQKRVESIWCLHKKCWAWCRRSGKAAERAIMTREWSLVFPRK